VNELRGTGISRKNTMLSKLGISVQGEVKERGDWKRRTNDYRMLHNSVSHIKSRINFVYIFIALVIMHLFHVPSQLSISNPKKFLVVVVFFLSAYPHHSHVLMIKETLGR
jgi:hypothetical protein